MFSEELRLCFSWLFCFISWINAFSLLYPITVISHFSILPEPTYCSWIPWEPLPHLFCSPPTSLPCPTPILAFLKLCLKYVLPKSLFFSVLHLIFPHQDIAGNRIKKKTVTYQLPNAVCATVWCCRIFLRQAHHSISTGCSVPITAFVFEVLHFLCIIFIYQHTVLKYWQNVYCCWWLYCCSFFFHTRNLASVCPFLFHKQNVQWHIIICSFLHFGFITPLKFYFVLRIITNIT